jgi:DNA-binding NarL/FixJ family response regulator
MRVLLADDHALFRDGLASLLQARDIEVAGHACDGLEALELARRLNPDVVLMDLAMPRCGGLEGTRMIKQELPGITVVILTVSEADDDLFEAIRAGASGYLVKSSPAEEFFGLLEALDRGEAPLSPGLAMRIIRHLGEHEDQPPGQGLGLTPREDEVLRLVAQGLTNQDIAAALFISVATVKFHMTHILHKLHLRSRAQAVAYAHQHGLAGPAEGGPASP